MAYHSQSDVEALLKQLNFTFTDVSKITLTQLQQYIVDTDLYVDNRLARIYAVPVTDAEAMTILRPVAAQLTASKCWRILYAAQQGESNKAKEWERLSETVLKQIISAEMLFGKAVKSSSHVTPWSALSESTPIWKMSTDQW